MKGVKCSGRVGVGGDLIHKSWLIQFLASERFLFLLLVGVFPAAHTPIRRGLPANDANLPDGRFRSAD
jgi:hypothetical protein